MSRSIRATVVVPTFDHGPMLEYSLTSAVRQTVRDIEIFVIGDGVPDVSRDIVGSFAGRDDRIRFFDHPKGPRHGEVYRHAALQEARGEAVCYLSDDDLWLPHHVESMLELLRGADFAHALPARIDPDGQVFVYPGDLSRADDRRQIVDGHNFIPLSHAAHTMELYRRLPHGWRTTPAGTYTDLYMWQQILADPSCRAVSGIRATVLNFPDSIRREMTAEERIDELRRWSERVERERDPGWFDAEVVRFLLRDRGELGAGRHEALTVARGLEEELERRSEQLRDAHRDLEHRERELERLESALRDREAEVRARAAELRRAYATRTWRMRQRLLRVPTVRRLARWIAGWRGLPGRRVRR